MVTGFFLYGIKNTINGNNVMICGIQIRSARAALKLSAKELAEKAGIGIQTVMRFESVDGVPPSRSSKLLLVQRTLENEGIEFIGSAENGPGVRLWKKETPK